MNERQWELYRLSVVERWSESPYKRAVSAAIEHKLMVLGQHTQPCPALCIDTLSPSLHKIRAR